jgi:DNA end-binding protein Ku
VKAYKAAGGGAGEIHFNQLHAECHSRIEYKKTCPVHGEVRNEEIVSGFEYSRGQYVVVNPDELDRLRTEDEKAITIGAFIAPDDLDPIYLTGKTYYLLPDAPVGQRPYAVLRQAMVEESRYAVAQVVLHGHEQTVLLRPMGKVLAMSILNEEGKVTKPAAFESQVPTLDASAEELNMTKRLIELSTARKFDFAALQRRVHGEVDEAHRSQGRRRRNRRCSGRPRAGPNHQPWWTPCAPAWPKRRRVRPRLKSRPRK